MAFQPCVDDALGPVEVVVVLQQADDPDRYALMLVAVVAVAEAALGGVEVLDSR